MKIKRCLLSQKVEGSGPRDNIRGIVESCPAMIYMACIYIRYTEMWLDYSRKNTFYLTEWQETINAYRQNTNI